MVKMKVVDGRPPPRSSSAETHRSEKWSKERKMDDQRIDVVDDPPVVRAGWRSLFNFTKKSHTTPLVLALVLSVVSGIVVPVVTIFVGRLFNSFTEFGGGKLSGPELVSKVSLDCLALVGIGGASWFLNGGYFMFWLVFGELQAKSARDQLFEGLMEKDMAWYDMRMDGIGALIPRLQRSVHQGPFSHQVDRG